MFEPELKLFLPIWLLCVITDLVSYNNIGQGNSAMSIRKITGYGKSMLRAMEESGHAIPMANGGWRIGARKISRPLADLFLKHDLVRKGEGGDLVLSPAGRAWVKRTAVDIKSGDDSRGVSAYQQQHQDNVVREVEVAGRTEKIIINTSESPLGWLAGRKDKDGHPLLRPGQFEAGERLREDYEMGHSFGRLTSVYEAVPIDKNRRGARDLNHSERRLAAKVRFDKAVIAMGAGLSDVACSICCHQNGLTQTERELGWPTRSAKVVLKIALDRLADHYGIEG